MQGNSQSDIIVNGEFGDEMNDNFRESDLSGNPSKMKQNMSNFSALEKESADQLRERLSCCICMNEIRCMMIQTCKHIPFCKNCDLELRMKTV